MTCMLTIQALKENFKTRNKFESTNVPCTPNHALSQSVYVSNLTSQ